MDAEDIKMWGNKEGKDRTYIVLLIYTKYNHMYNREFNDG